MYQEAPRQSSPADPARRGAAAALRMYSAVMALTLPVPQASGHLSELVDRARRGHERVVLTEHGQPAAVLIAVDELDELQRIQDERDIALCETIKARDEAGMPHEEFMASLGAAP